MITKQKIIIYLWYQDADFFARVGKKEEKDLMNVGDWALIDSFIQDVYLLKNNLVSSKMQEKIKLRINGYTEGDNELIEKLFNIN